MLVKWLFYLVFPKKSESALDQTSKGYIGGYVYVLSNPSLEFGMVKIGMTTREDPQVRVDELNRSTSSPTPFVIEHLHPCVRPYDLEKRLHRVFDERRVNNKREFFMVEVHEVVRQIEKLKG